MTGSGAEAASCPIFILGTQRSGTTLLRLMLDSHEHLAIGFESGFMIAAENIKNIPGWNYGKKWYRRYGMDEADINEHIRRFYTGIFSEYAARQGKQRWGEKTPNLAPLADMAEIFPNAKLICIVRHPGAVAASLMRWDYTFERALDYWLTSNRRIRRLAPQLGPQRLHICRYEDLVSDPKTVLGQIMEFVDEPWSDNLLRHHEIQSAKGAPEKVEGGTRTDRPVDADALDAWREKVNQEQIAQMRGRPLLKFFGYRPRTAVPVGPIEDPFPPSAEQD